MKFVNVLEHNGELYKIGDDIEATFDTGITTSGKIKQFGSYGFLEEGLKSSMVSFSSSFFLLVACFDFDAFAENLAMKSLSSFALCSAFLFWSFACLAISWLVSYQKS